MTDTTVAARPAAQRHRLIRLPEVERRTSQSKTEIYKGMREGTFPQCVQISARAVGWVEEEINDYIAAKIAARDAKKRASG